MSPSSLIFCLLHLVLAMGSNAASMFALNQGEAFLPNWQGHLMEAIGNLSVLNLTFPGTHDSQVGYHFRSDDYFLNNYERVSSDEPTVDV